MVYFIDSSLKYKIKIGIKDEELKDVCQNDAQLYLRKVIIGRQNEVKCNFK